MWPCLKKRTDLFVQISDIKFHVVVRYSLYATVKSDL